MTAQLGTSRAAERKTAVRTRRATLSAGARADRERKGEARQSLIFTTTGTTPVSGWSRMKGRLDAAMLAAAREEGRAVIPPWTLHDLRRTFVTGMVELHVPPHVVELVVNHISGTRAASPAPTTAPSCFPNARRRSNAGRRT